MPDSGGIYTGWLTQITIEPPVGDFSVLTHARGIILRRRSTDQGE